jgi:hypothetical protein
MPRFKSTQNIFGKDGGEVFDPNWMDHDTLVLPPSTPWSYDRQMQIEDVDIWEVIYEQGGAVAVFASWCPYAEFYLVRVGWYLESKNHGVETYYGAGAQQAVQDRMKELKIPITTNSYWVEPEDMWLHQPREIVDLIL